MMRPRRFLLPGTKVHFGHPDLKGEERTGTVGPLDPLTACYAVTVDFLPKDQPKHHPGEVVQARFYHGHPPTGAAYCRPIGHPIE